MYSLRKSKAIFCHFLRLYRRKHRHISSPTRLEIKERLNALQENILQGNREEAAKEANRVEKLAKKHLKKSFFEQIRDSIFALIVALFFAVLIRSMWFEFYEIPSGSMRPTFQEKDHLVVSKTAFGINIPLLPRHFYFDPALVKRNGILIFTGANMDIANVNTRYFYLFPGKKQYVKRLIGKPGDTLYFYGGLIYGIDREGKDISNKLQVKSLQSIDHVPYIHINGKVILPSMASTSGIYSPVTLKQMNIPVAKLELKAHNRLEGELLPPYKEKIADYYDLWGFKNYGLSRLLTKEQVTAFTDTPLSQLEDAPLYLEIIHHPSVKTALIARGMSGKLHPSVGTNYTVLPLGEKTLSNLFSHLYTARFIVKNGLLYRLGSTRSIHFDHYCPRCLDIPDGTYEFYHGQAYQILWGGIRKKLPASHPLSRYDQKRLQLFYNLGIEFNTLFSPNSKHPSLIPSRYVYYRNGDLYAMGAPLLGKEEQELIRFIQKEKQKQEQAPVRRPYHPFIDAGPPIKENGEIDISFIRRYGITVPEKQYLVLGDNYAMSADSRDFGFVPEDNIRGAPLFLLWPPGDRIGKPNQIAYPIFNLPKLLIWSTAFIIFAIWWAIYRSRFRLPISID